MLFLASPVEFDINLINLWINRSCSKSVLLIHVVVFLILFAGEWVLFFICLQG